MNAERGTMNLHRSSLNVCRLSFVPPLLSIDSVSKSFGDQAAVRDLSFTVEPGEIFGLLGPNGAGKTTTLRMVLDLFKPDSGTIEVFGGPIDEHKKDRIGYMPEERGLYDDLKLTDCLHYLGTLKGLGRRQAKTRVEAALKRFDLWDHRKKKVEKLSRGMAQKAQIIAATLHDPDLLIVDEPFANLDPVNVELVKTTLRESGFSSTACHPPCSVPPSPFDTTFPLSIPAKSNIHSRDARRVCGRGPDRTRRAPC